MAEPELSVWAPGVVIETLVTLKVNETLPVPPTPPFTPEAPGAPPFLLKVALWPVWTPEAPPPPPPEESVVPLVTEAPPPPPP